MVHAIDANLSACVPESVCAYKGIYTVFKQSVRLHIINTLWQVTNVCMHSCACLLGRACETCA